MPGFTDSWSRWYRDAWEVQNLWYTYTYTTRSSGGYTNASANTAPAPSPTLQGAKYPVKSASYLMMFGLDGDKISAEMHGPGGYYTLSGPDGSNQFRRWPEGFDYDHFMKLRHADGY